MVRRLILIPACLLAAVAAWPVAWAAAGATLASGAGPAGQVPAAIATLGAPFLLGAVVYAVAWPHSVVVRPVADTPELEPAR